MAKACARTLLSAIFIFMTSLPSHVNVRAAILLTSNGNINTGSDATNAQNAQAPQSGTGSGGTTTTINGTVIGDVEVFFASPVSRSDGGGGGGGKRGANIDDGDFDVGRMTSMVEGMTKQDWMAFICNRLPVSVPECQGVLDLDKYLEIHRDRLVGVFQSVKKRKRRSLADPFWTDPWQNFGGINLGFPPSGFNPFHNPVAPAVTPQPGAPVAPVHNPINDPFVGGSGFTRKVLCPTPIDQTAIYQPVADGTGYPADEIGDEIINPTNLALRTCLALEIVTANAPPIPVIEPFRETAQPTCPFTQSRLWRYQSFSQGSECWVLQNFGDFVLYRTCMNKFCSNCKDARTRTYGWHGFGSSSAVANNYVMQKLCIPDFRAVSFWAYCPANAPGVRIVRDRIVIPITCNCQGVRCDPVPQGGYQG